MLRVQTLFSYTLLEEESGGIGFARTGVSLSAVIWQFACQAACADLMLGLMLGHCVWVPSHLCECHCLRSCSSSTAGLHSWAGLRYLQLPEEQVRLVHYQNGVRCVTSVPQSYCVRG